MASIGVAVHAPSFEALDGNNDVQIPRAVAHRAGVAAPFLRLLPPSSSLSPMMGDIQLGANTCTPSPSQRTRYLRRLCELSDIVRPRGAEQCVLAPLSALN